MGLKLALLQWLALDSRGGYTELARHFGVSAGTIKLQMTRMEGAGFVGNPRFCLLPFVPLKGRVLLRLVHELCVQHVSGALSPELQHILGKLRLNPTEEELKLDIASFAGDPFGVSPYARLMNALGWAIYNWGFDVAYHEYAADPNEISSDVFSSALL